MVKDYTKASSTDATSFQALCWFSSSRITVEKEEGFKREAISNYTLGVELLKQTSYKRDRRT